MTVEKTVSEISTAHIGKVSDWSPRREISPVDPTSHTMTEAAFYNYIGRPRPEGDAPNRLNTPIIDFKKFSPEQKEMIARAYAEGCNVVVFGAPRNYIHYIAKELEAKPQKIADHVRHEKTFNRFRQSMCFVNNKDDSIELWVFVFPSREYVDQVAEYITSIVYDFERNGVPKGKSKCCVFVQHYPLLEAELTIWTGFDSAIKTIVRYGDVVAIGHVESLRETLKQIGFESGDRQNGPGLDSTWREFGVLDIFGSAVMVSRLNSRRIVLIGFKECFWGSASGLYVSALIDAGARHILYGSKAATLVGHAEIASVAAPRSCLLLEYDGRDASDEGKHFPEAVENILVPFGISKAGVSLTVPTVIGETKEQAIQYKWHRPVCMDCENGHISKQVKIFNEKREKSGWKSKPPMPVQFLPLHFITDYIHTGNEEISQVRINKAVNFEVSAREGGSFLTQPNSVEEHKERQKLKTDAFEKIGAFFGYYAHIYGLADSFSPPTTRRPGRFDLEDIKTAYQKLFSSMAAGYSREAVAEAIDDYKSGPGAGSAELLALAMAAQKCGFLRLFDSIDELLRDSTKGPPLSEQASVWLLVLRLKTLSQVGDVVHACEVVEHIRAATNGEGALKESDQFHPFRRRLGLTEVALGKDKEGFRKLCPRIAIWGNRRSYEGITYRYFFMVAVLMRFKRLDGYRTAKLSKRLADIRTDYYRVTESTENWMHAHREKASIAAIFLEAAFHLKGERVQKAIGLRLLYLAHLLNVRYGGNERSEGYGEILWAAGQRYTRDVIALAMRRDERSRSFFQRHIFVRDAAGASRIFSRCSEILKEKDHGRQIEQINSLASAIVSNTSL